MMAWLQVAIVFSVIILVHEFGHFLLARRVGVKIEIFSFGFGPRLFSFKRDDIEYRISAIPFGGYIKMAGDDPAEERKGEPWEFLSQSVGNRLKIVFAGPLLNYILGFILFSLVFYMGYPTLSTKIGDLLDGYPAKKSGIRVGDEIIAIDGKPARHWEEITEIIHKKTEGSLTLTLNRSGSEIIVTLTPLVKSTKDLLGRTIKIGLIGIAPSEKIEYVKYGMLKSFELGFERLMKITVLTYQGLWRILTGAMSFRESAAGPIGIFNIMVSVAKIGIIPLLQLTAYLSALLTIFNVLPIPALDGGHMMFLFLEKVRGKPVSRRAQEIATQVGMTFLIALMLFVSYNDILRLLKK
ncbi:MAG: RIP metalloprotease RseP [Candidatus Omnitrophota bacterium]